MKYNAFTPDVLTKKLVVIFSPFHDQYWTKIVGQNEMFVLSFVILKSHCNRELSI